MQLVKLPPTLLLIVSAALTVAACGSVVAHPPPNGVVSPYSDSYYKGYRGKAKNRRVFDLAARSSTWGEGVLDLPLADDPKSGLIPLAAAHPKVTALALVGICAMSSGKCGFDVDRRELRDAERERRRRAAMIAKWKRVQCTEDDRGPFSTEVPYEDCSPEIQAEVEPTIERIELGYKIPLSNDRAPYANRASAEAVLPGGVNRRDDYFRQFIHIEGADASVWAYEDSEGDGYRGPYCDVDGDWYPDFGLRRVVRAGHEAPYAYYYSPDLFESFCRLKPIEEE